MEKKIKAATIQELGEMIKTLQDIKRNIKSNKTEENAECFVTREVDKIYCGVRSLGERLEYCFKGE